MIKSDERQAKHESIPRLDFVNSNLAEYLMNKRYWARRGIKWPFEGIDGYGELPKGISKRDAETL